MRTRYIFCPECHESGKHTQSIKVGTDCPGCGEIAASRELKQQINTLIRTRHWDRVNEDCCEKPTGVFTGLGVDYEYHVQTDSDVQKIYDKYNKDYEGERYAQVMYL